VAPMLVHMTVSTLVACAALGRGYAAQYSRRTSASMPLLVPLVRATVYRFTYLPIGPPTHLLAFTRYSFTPYSSFLALVNRNVIARSIYMLTLLRYYCTTNAQHTTPHPTPLVVYVIHHTILAMAIPVSHIAEKLVATRHSSADALRPACRC